MYWDALSNASLYRPNAPSYQPPKFKAWELEPERQGAKGKQKEDESDGEHCMSHHELTRDSFTIKDDVALILTYTA